MPETNNTNHLLQKIVCAHGVIDEIVLITADICLRNVDGVSRNPLVPKQDATLEEKNAFANKIREVCKELIADDCEYTNAK